MNLITMISLTFAGFCALWVIAFTIWANHIVRTAKRKIEQYETVDHKIKVAQEVIRKNWYKEVVR